MRIVVILALLLIPGLVVAAPPAFVGTWKRAHHSLEIAGTGTSTVVMTFSKSK